MSDNVTMQDVGKSRVLDRRLLISFFFFFSLYFLVLISQIISILVLYRWKSACYGIIN